MSEINTAVGSYGQAISYLLKRQFLPYLIVPVAINVALIAAIIGLAWVYTLPLAEALTSYIHIDPESFWHFILPVLGVLVFVLLFLLYLMVYKYLVLILLAPFLAILSERVEEELTGQSFPFSWRQLLRDIGRAILINLRNFSIEIVASIALSLLAFIPIVGFAAPFLLIAVQSYFYGFALMDFNAERHRLSRQQTEQWMRRHYLAVTGQGLLFYLLFLIPIIGWVIAPIWATIAGTITWLNLTANFGSGLATTKLY